MAADATASNAPSIGRPAARSRASLDRLFSPGRWWPAVACAALLAVALPALAAAQEGNAFDADAAADGPPDADALTGAADEAPGDGSADLGVFLPGDRGRERLLDRARRLAGDERWSDAAAALDELLADERDAFVTGGSATTRGSIRSEAAALVDQLPRAGRDAYERLFGSRAEQGLSAAIAADDSAAIVAVARRWLHTPAGRQAAMIVAVRAIEAGQPLAAGAWLDRLARAPAAADFEPTLSVMRAAATWAAGDEGVARQQLAAAARGHSRVRLAGQERPISPDAAAARGLLAGIAAPSDKRLASGRDWRQFRGTPLRNGIVDASRPLLVPRYRVPLVRHPEEARRLEKHRQAAAAEGDAPTPAGTPLAVGDHLVVQTPLGILAVDFDSGRRLWLETAVATGAVDAAEDAEGGAPPPVFQDMTSGNLASDGGIVFAVESRLEAVSPARVGVTGFGRMAGGAEAAWEDGNILSAYDLHTGRVRWRLAGLQGAAGDDDAAARWHMGPPLVVGDELYLLVEERGEVRLEVRAAGDASLRWMQPLATYDDGDAITSLEAVDRRVAGLTPALAEGLLVCPIGGGCVVAIDVAARSLLWAHAYPRPEAAREQGPFRPDAPGGRRGFHWPGEPAPVIASDRVLLAPFDSDVLLCLGLRDGKPLWQRPRTGRLDVAGVVEDRLLLVGSAGVEAVALATGRRLWSRPLGDGVRPSGRGVLTPRSLLVPCDLPGVIEIAAADGRILGRSVARDGVIPGNLVAHRGEVISRGVDSLDVFHQQAALDDRIETALRTDPASPWAAYWRGQASVESGDVADGLDALARAAMTPGFRVPPGDLAAAFVHAMRRDFATAAGRWAALPGNHAGQSASVDRVIVDGFLALDQAEPAWDGLRRLMTAPADPPGEPPTLLRDAADPRLRIAADRWLRSRLARLTAAADEPLRGRIDAACRDLVATARAASDPIVRRRLLAMACERLGTHPAADAAREALLELAAGDGRTTVQAELLALGAAPADSLAPADVPADPDSAWPLGRVDRRDLRGPAERDPNGGLAALRPVPMTVEGGRARAVHAAIDVSRQRLVVTDRLGRALTRPLPVAGLAGGFGLQFLHQSGAVELAALGRLVFVRSGAGIVAHDVADGAAGGDELWRNDELGTDTDESGVRWGVGGRVARDGAAPLGLRIGEPDERPRGGGRGLTALPEGLVVPGRRAVTVLDPASGTRLWERDNLPPGLEWFVDGQFLCGCTVDGRGSLVLAMDDGRLLHAFDVPHRRQRVAARGRRFVAVQPLDERSSTAVAPRVRLDLVDPADREARPLGVFDGQARAVETGDGRLAVLEPGGRLTVLDLADGGVVFSRELPGIPQRVERLHVLAWQDRYLVVAGVNEGDEPQAADVSPLEPLLFGGGSAAPLSGAVWAVDRDDGLPLWPVPAIIERHCLHTAQPTGLPLLTFCRIIQPRGRGLPALSVLCLDKRTGHAVFEDDRLGLDGPAAGGCELTGDPDEHTVTIRDAGVAGGSVVLTFTGGPMAPRPPFRNRGRPPSPTAGADLLEGRIDAGGRRGPGTRAGRDEPFRPGLPPPARPADQGAP